MGGLGGVDALRKPYQPGRCFRSSITRVFEIEEIISRRRLFVSFTIIHARTEKIRVRERIEELHRRITAKYYRAEKVSTRTPGIPYLKN